jgi:hypothetical protein
MCPTAGPDPVNALLLSLTCRKLNSDFTVVQPKAQSISESGTINTNDEQATYLNGHRSDIRYERLSKTTNLPNSRYPDTHSNPVLHKNYLHINLFGVKSLLAGIKEHVLKIRPYIKRRITRLTSRTVCYRNGAKFYVRELTKLTYLKILTSRW